MTTQPEALRLADALENTPNWQKEEWGSNWKASVMQYSREPFEAAAELRRLYEANQELLEALNWIDSRCPAMLMDHPLHAIHREMSHDAGACARAAIAKAEEKA